MSFLRPVNLVPVTLVYQGAMDALTDVPIGKIHVSGEIYYIDVVMHDANATFDETDITLKILTQAIDVITIAAQAGTPVITSVTKDNLTEASVSAGDTVLMTVENVSTGADLGCAITLWINPTDDGL